MRNKHKVKPTFSPPAFLHGLLRSSSPNSSSPAAQGVGNGGCGQFVTVFSTTPFLLAPSPAPVRVLQERLQRGSLLGSAVLWERAAPENLLQGGFLSMGSAPPRSLLQCGVCGLHLPSAPGLGHLLSLLLHWPWCCRAASHPFLTRNYQNANLSFGRTGRERGGCLLFISAHMLSACWTQGVCQEGNTAHSLTG